MGPSEEVRRATRVLPQASYVELSHRKAVIQHELRARLYLYDDVKLIVCSVAGISETGNPTVLPLDVSDSDLGCCICDHLLEFDPKSPTDMRSHKKSDWGAYRVSGAKSMRRFEEKSWMALIATVNSVIVINAFPRNSLWPEINAYGSSSPLHDKLGRTVRRTLRAAMVLRENGIV
jgi:hypothetical protein